MCSYTYVRTHCSVICSDIEDRGLFVINMCLFITFRIHVTRILPLLASVLLMTSTAEKDCNSFDVIVTCPYSFGAVIQTVPNVANFPACTRLCIRQDVCYSAVYAKKTSTCQLNGGRSTLNVNGCNPAEMVTIATRRVVRFNTIYLLNYCPNQTT